MKPPAAIISCACIALFATFATTASAASRPYFATETARFALPAGYSPVDVAIEAGWIAVLAVNYDADTAALFPYWRASPTTWVSAGKLFETPFSNDDGDNPLAMAMQNSTIAMSWGFAHAPVIFRRSGSTWAQQVVTLSSSELQGAEIKIDGERILAGAGECGDAEVFEPDTAGTWRSTAHLDEGIGFGCGEFHYTSRMALSGNTALLYMSNESENTFRIGAWQHTSAGWQRFGQLPDSALQKLRPVISLRGSLAVTEAEFPGGSNHVYLRSGNNWNTLASFRPLDAYQLTDLDGFFRQRRGWLAQRRDDSGIGGWAIVDVWQQGSDNRFSHVAQVETHDRAAVYAMDIYDNRVVSISRSIADGYLINVFELPSNLSTPTPVRDDFQGGGNATWHSVAGPTPRASGGRFVQSSTAAQTMALAGNTGWSNQAIEGDFSPTTGTNAQSYAGLVARAGSGKYYYAVLRKNGSVELGKVLSGARTVLASAPYTPRAWNRLRLEARGQLLDVQVDGRQLLTSNDAGIASGESGFTTSYTALALDNFTTTPRSQKMYEARFDRERNSAYFPWTVSGGDWPLADEASNTIRRQRATSGGARLITGVPTDEQTVETTVRIDGTFAADGNWVGVIARYTDNHNLYYLSLRGSHQLTIRKVVGGVATELAGQTFNAVPGRYYDLRLEVVGGKLRGYVNGELRLEATDYSLETGRAGIATNNTQASFAHFLAYQP